MNLLWGILAIAAQAISIGLIIALFFPKFRASPFARFFSDRAVLVAFIVSLLATVGSLIYSDVIGYDPCKLCWFQRIFMYPQVLLMGIALWNKDRGVRVYGLALSIIGGFVSLFHYLGQRGHNILGLDCLALGQAATCSKNFVFIFGYITIPFMAFSAFALIALSLWLSLKKDKESLSSSL